MSRSLVPLCIALAVSLVWLAASLPAHGQGTIRYVPNVNMGFPRGMVLPLDIDGNGTPDFVFENSGLTFEALPQAGSHILAIPATLPDLGAYALPLAMPSELGNYDYSPAQWAGSVGNLGFPGRVGFNACSTIGCAGPFVGIKGYFGFSIEIDGQTHYGWGLFNALGGGPGGVLEEYAYNLTPGAPIFAGQVPEPGTWALLLVGAGLLGWRTWRSRQRA